ncbi:bile acid-CoA:amino acid N-acyltransferase-like isoform X1 [Salarias fasciatus]|uniref:Bile acid-CoA:amino acid N-acyltransferase-like n=1 Tax=Salarias fasciatus TaxID=181472 RepID=A0A672ILW5_SALFA|nr:bile acid-CoA:amino acid N-acyltransferase-like isoform X1 [Salarias fasciatus]
MRMISRLIVRGNLVRVQHAVGAVRWQSSRKQAPVLTAAPVRALIDEQISIKGRFLPPHSPVTVCARMHCEDGDLWEAFAHYNTNASGAVNLTSDHSLGGSYLGCEPMGLFWGLQPAPGGRQGLRLRKKNVETPYQVHISLMEGHVSPSDGKSSELAVVTTERWYMAPGVRRTEIRQNGVVGTLFLPPGPGPFPGVLDMWGMGGGLPEYRSSLLASKGYASLTLSYIEHKDLPGPPDQLNVGDSYFRSAYQLLQDLDEVDADRIGLIGLSYGVYVSLRIATQCGVKPSCVICINGPFASTIPYPEDGFSKHNDSTEKYYVCNDQGYVQFKDAMLPTHLALEHRVKLENLACPLMVIVAEDDGMAASSKYADMMEEILKSAGKSQLFTRLSYPDAGHLIEPPYSPHARESFYRVKPQKLMIVFGGHPASHAAAQEDSWRKMLDFLETNLRR